MLSLTRVAPKAAGEPAARRVRGVVEEEAAAGAADRPARAADRAGPGVAGEEVGLARLGERGVVGARAWRTGEGREWHGVGGSLGVVGVVGGRAAGRRATGEPLDQAFFAPADGEEGGEGGWWDLSSPGSVKCKGPSGP